MKNLTLLEQVARGLVKLPSSSNHTAMIGIVNILIMIDRSGSMGASCGRVDRLEAAKEAILSLIKTMIHSSTDYRLSVIAFDDEAQLILPLTSCSNNSRGIRQALQSITVGGGTDLKTPLVMANALLPAEGQHHAILLSDGHGGNPIRAARRLKDRGVIIETIGVGNFPSEVDEPILKKIASVVDGRMLYRFLTDADQIVHYFRNDIANRLAKRG